jgi:hypothetical protein
MWWFQRCLGFDPKILTSQQNKYLRTAPPIYDPKNLRSQQIKYLQTAPPIHSIICLGGSATAGGGGILHHQQYPSILEKMLQQHHQQSTVLNMAHGKTNTFYTALNFDSLVPSNASVITWEFSINDPYSLTRQALNEYIDQMELFMDMVNQHPNKPTIVFIMLWDTPFTLPPHSTVWDNLRHLLKNQPIVDVNKWINSKNSNNRLDFVNDQHHPNELVHQYIANELLNIILVDKQSNLFMDHRVNAFPFRSKNTIFNGRFHRPSRTKSILFDIPNLKEFYQVHNVNKQPLKIHGKSYYYRKDRELSLKIPSCSDDINSFQLYLDFKLKETEQLSVVSFGGTKPEFGKYLKVIYHPTTDGSEEGTILTMAPWNFPSENYHDFYKVWFESRKRLLNNGRITVCSIIPATVNYVDIEIRWLSLVMTQ